MPNNILVIAASPASPEREDEFNYWSNIFHLQQILRVPGILAGTRYKLSHTQMDWFPPMSGTPEWPYGKDSYLCIFEVDPAADAGEVFQALKDDEPNRQTHKPEDDPVRWGSQYFFEAITDRETQVWLEPGSSDLAARGDARPNAIFVVPTTPVSPEVEAEYDKWYITQMNLRVPGIVAGTRYKLSSVQGTVDSRGPEREGAWPYGQHSHLMIYELSDVVTAANALRARVERTRVASTTLGQPQASGSRNSWMAPWGPLRKADEHVVYEPVTNRAERTWIRDPRAI